VVQSFFDEETDDPVGVEDKVCSVGSLVSDHGQECYKLRSLREGMNILKCDWSRNSCGWFQFLWAVVWAHTLLWRNWSLCRGSHVPV